MEFRILGPLQVLDDGESLDLGPFKQRSLLALLLINANRVVSTDRILDELWGDDAEGKEKVLWVYVSRLRSVLEPDREERGQSSVLLTRDNGYTLSVDSDSIDARRFEAAAAEGSLLIRDDAAAAAEILREALQLWRGSALQDFSYQTFAQAEITRLEELRLTAVEDRIEADLGWGQAGELVGELEALQQQHPLRERPVGQLMLALYRAGRQADALRTFERFRRGIGEELGIEPSPELRLLEEQILLHDSRLQPRRVHRSETGPLAPTDIANPFKGLRPFHEDDADDFFGRDRLVAEVVRRLTAKDHLIGLVGPSGSGKSSVVRAGLIPAVRKAVLLGSDRWLIAQMVPGSRPFAELEAALLRSTIDAPDSLLQQLHSDEAGLLRAVLRILPDDASKLLLVIDQFEELFTLVDDEDVRRRFLTNLVVALDDPHHRVLIVLTLRADFYDRPLRYPEFGIRLGSGVINVVPLSLDEFEAATLEPATRSGVSLEPELLAELLADVVGEPGSLPMFQYTLTELFDRRVGDTLTAATYRSMGGVQGALTRRADDLYDQLDPEQQQVAKQLFLRLVTITEQDEWSRRRVRASEMVSLDVDIVAMQTVIDLFGSHRLLTFDRDQVSGAPTLEVAHEALLSEWGRLRVWIEESRDDLQRHAALATAARDWANAGRDDDYLYTGSRLAEYERWSTATSMKLTASEREYLDAALERRERESTAESERVAHEARLERRARARLWSMVAAVVVLVSVGIGLLIAAFGPEEPSVAVVAGNESIDELLETGLAQAERELGVRTELLTGRFSDAEKQYRDLAETGFDLIFVGREVSGLGWVEDVIAAYPDTAFATMDPLSPVDGALSIYFADEEGAYLAGAAAALTTKTGVVGFVGAAQFELLERWRAGYEAGAWTVNPDIEILSTYISADISGFSDVAGGRAAATQLYQRNADVVLSAAGDSSLGVFEAAWQQSQDTGIHRWAIGPDSDWWLEVADHLRPHVLTSMIKKMDAAMFETIKDFTEGRFEPGVTTLTLSHGAYALSPSGGNLTNGDLETISDLTESVVAGVITLPEVPDGGLMPPPGVEVSEVVSVTLTFDGEQCRYEGPSVLSAGVVEITYHNESAERGWASLLRLDDDKTSQDLRDYAADLSNSDKPLWTSYVWLQQTISAHSSSIPALGTVGPGLHAMVCGTWTPYVPYIGSNVTVEP